MNDILKSQIELLPNKPGCYLMHDKNDVIIYIGKAKNLKNRVSQYFLRSQNGKTAAMVSHVDHFETIITKSEKEALILEMNLIQTHHPRYNIMLMDDKHYPYIAIHKEVKDPYVSLSRNIKNKKCEYFGPYPNSKAAYEIVNMINKLFPLRKCNTVPKSACLYFHMGRCLAPCINDVKKEEYQKIIDDIDTFLKGNNTKIIGSIKEKIYKTSEQLDFESAQEYKKMLDYIEHISEKQIVEFKDNINRDIFAFYIREGYVSLACFIYRNGILLAKRSFCYSLIGEINEFVSSLIYQYYQVNTVPKEIIVSNKEIEETLLGSLDATVLFPTKGKLHDVISVVEINAKEALDAHFLTARLDDDKFALLEKLGKILNIKTPIRIELFDNSHLQGTNAIGAMVVFINGEPYKKMYRKFNIESINKKDDLSSMKESLTRRYSRLKNEGEQFPDLVIVDGGTTQLEVAKEVMKGLDLKIPFAGLVKSDKHRTSALMDEKFNEYNLTEDKDLFFLLTRMQDEVHRYAINTHIKKRNKNMFASVFDDIKGIGIKRKEELTKTYPSIKELKNASLEELKQLLPEESAVALYNKLKEI